MRTNELIVVYDIPDTKKRNAVIKSCRAQGLLPLQFSVYGGALTQTRRRELRDDVSKILRDGKGHVMIIPMERRMFSETYNVGTPLVAKPNFWSPGDAIV